MAEEPSAKRNRDEVDRAACVASDPTATPEQLNAAATVLLPVIQRIADRVAARSFGSIRRDVEDGAVSHVWTHISRYSGEKAGFRQWCYKVVVNLAIGFWRQHRPALPLITDPPQSARPDPQEVINEAEPLCKERRAALDEIWMGDRSATTVRYPAVLLMRLRLAQAARFTEIETHEWLAMELSCRSVHVAQCFPWHEHEEAARFLTGLPTLKAIWERAEDRVDHPPFRMNDEAFCDLVSGMAGQPLTVDVWGQWGCRAKQHARSQIGEERWSRLFGGLLPDH